MLSKRTSLHSSPSYQRGPQGPQDGCHKWTEWANWIKAEISFIDALLRWGTHESPWQLIGTRLEPSEANILTSLMNFTCASFTCLRMMPVLLSFVLIQLGLTFTVRALPLNATPITTVQSSSSDSSLLIESDLANALLYRDGGTEPDLGRNDGMQWQPSSLTVESDLQHGKMAWNHNSPKRN
jgi:hypothetical protein